MSVINESVASRLPKIKADALSLFPLERDFNGRGKMKAMRVLQKILLTFAMVAGLSVAAFAQKEDPKKPPPKPSPPVVNPAPTKPPPDPKKPHGGIAVIWIRTEGDSA